MTKRLEVNDKGWILGNYTAHPVTIKGITYNTTNGTYLGTYLNVLLDEMNDQVERIPKDAFLDQQAVEQKMKERIKAWQNALKKFKQEVKNREV